MKFDLDQIERQKAISKHLASDLRRQVDHLKEERDAVDERIFRIVRILIEKKIIR